MTFETNIDGGLTVFFPTDAVINDFLPKYENLTTSQEASLLLYHGIPLYQSLQMLNNKNGLVNLLPTNKANKFDFIVQNDDEVVSLETEVVTAKIMGTLINEERLVIYKMNKVLQQTKLFKVKTAPALKEVVEELDDSADALGSNDSEDQMTSFLVAKGRQIKGMSLETNIFI
ncbi:unnamed protein product [Prunus armeniaca]|uniref:FAS1 domain-containing protein n=1 Tax=Prunus armeniaca TaxID=36596 RepID=A0A6J5TW17_PRUAR|nr:unnamed protein product [Prunus armeniaca]